MIINDMIMLLKVLMGFQRNLSSSNTYYTKNEVFH